MKPNLSPDQLQKGLENKTQRRLKKKRPKMLISGKSVLNLRRIIQKKSAQH